MSALSFEVCVARKSEEAVDICTFELVSVDREHLPSFSAGSHIDIALPGGLTRQYSLCNDPHETHRYLVAVLKAPDTRGGSKAMHELVKEGDILRISPPRNHFSLAHEAKSTLLLAGGIGVTPLLCMAERLAIVGADFEMHYCTRSLERTAFRNRIINSSFASAVSFHFDDGAPEQRLNINELLETPPPSKHLYVCGPKGFMDAALSKARAAGWAETQLHYEFFSAAPQKSTDDGSFEVKLASSGRIIPIPAGQSVAEALAAADVEVAISCEQGICGTCLTRVLEGVPDHRDSFLTKDERAANNQFTPCCSRSKTTMLVLDL
jgi:vanillate O-demethylase ferredoxin subunit